MRLLIDIGNHRFKWMFAPDTWAGEELANQDSSHLAVGEKNWPVSLQALCEAAVLPRSVYVSSVADADVDSVVAGFVQDTWGLETFFLESPGSICGIRNDYLEPAALGVDRWAALVGACARAENSPVLVIDAGTAVTIDYVGTDRIFRGGVIVPGLHAMSNTLNVSTARIQAQLGEGAVGELNLQNPDTQGAVENGVRLALTSALTSAIRYFTDSAGEGLRVFVTGGDATWAQTRIDQEMIFAPSLVLEGVQRMAAELESGDEIQ